MNAPLHVERRASSLELTLNRPALRNALSRALIGALTDAFQSSAADAAVRSVILTGAPPAFCAGLDLREVAESVRHAGQHDTSALLALYETIERLPKPVIAAVNGPAVAGGAILACVCDVVVCAGSARVGFPGIQHGLVAPIVMPYLNATVGPYRARYLLLTGEILPASRAAEFGLVHEVVADVDLLPTARSRAAAFAAVDPAALAQTKSLLGRLRELAHPDYAAQRWEMSRAIGVTDARGANSVGS